GTITSPHRCSARTPGSAPPRSSHNIVLRSGPVRGVVSFCWCLRLVRSAPSVTPRPSQYIICPRASPIAESTPTASQYGIAARKSGTVLPSVLSGGARGAQSENLGGVIHVDEVVFLGDPGRPAFNRLRVNLNCTPAFAADEVVVVFGSHAPAEQALPVTRAQHVHLTCLGKRGEGAVHGGEPHRVAGIS